MVKGDDFFFQRPLCNQTIDGHRAMLTNVMRTASSLIFGGGVPPRVGYDHIIGCCEVEPKTTRFEADQKEMAFTRLKCCDAAVALCMLRLSLFE